MNPRRGAFAARVGAVFASAGLVFSLASGARAQFNAPATKEPHSPAWGPDFRDRLQRVYAKLLDQSGYDSPAQRAKDDRSPTQLFYNPNFRAAGGSPAAAVYPRTDVNPSDHAIVFVGYGIFEICRNDDELAFILGHEMSHLALHHHDKFDKKRMELGEPWLNAHPEVLKQDTASAVKAVEAGIGPDLEAFERSQESQADSNGQQLARQAGYDVDSAASALEHGKDWVWATGGDEKEDVKHDPLADRIKQLRKQAAQSHALDAAMASGTGATGGLKQASAAMGAAGVGVSAGNQVFDGNARQGNANAPTGARSPGASPLLGSGVGAGSMAGGLAGADAVQESYGKNTAAPPSAAQSDLKARVEKDSNLASFYSNLKPDEKAEFDKLYGSYDDHVRQRDSEGWGHGWSSNFKVNAENPDDHPDRYTLDKEAQKLQTATIPELTRRAATEQPKIDRLKAELAAASDDDEKRRLREDLRKAEAPSQGLESAQSRLSSIQATQKKRFGLCTDWAQDNAALAQDQKPQYFDAKTITRSPLPEKTDSWPVVGGMGQHTGALLCAKSDPTNCVVLDSWADGAPDLKTRTDWVGSKYVR